MSLNWPSSIVQFDFGNIWISGCKWVQDQKKSSFISKVSCSCITPCGHKWPDFKLRLFMSNLHCVKNTLAYIVVRVDTGFSWGWVDSLSDPREDPRVSLKRVPLIGGGQGDAWNCEQTENNPESHLFCCSGYLSHQFRLLGALKHWDLDTQRCTLL